MIYGDSGPHNILTIGTLIHSHLGHWMVDTQSRGPCTHLLYIDTADWIHQVHNQMRVLIPESCAFSCEQNMKTAYFIWKICTCRFWWIQWIVSEQLACIQVNQAQAGSTNLQFNTYRFAVIIPHLGFPGPHVWWALRIKKL